MNHTERGNTSSTPNFEIQVEIKIGILGYNLPQRLYSATVLEIVALVTRRRPSRKGGESVEQQIVDAFPAVAIAHGVNTSCTQ